jgi:Mrp family chromosome partitioning ATPase
MMEQAFKAKSAAQQKISETDRPHLKVDRPADMESVRSADSDHSQEKTSLRPYVLNGATASEQERQKLERLVGRRGPGALIRRTHEVTLDPARIDPHLVGIIEDDSPAAEQYDQLAISLITATAGHGHRRILLASAQHGEGRTCVALNLAGALARAQRQVLVLDCDLHQPSVLRLLGIDTERGLVEAIGDGISSVEAVTHVLPAQFDILAIRERVPNAAKVLASPKFLSLLEQYTLDYDFILVDSPPLLVSANARLLAYLADTTLLVIRPGQNKPAQMAKALALFAAEEICGVVLNRTVD